MPPVFYVLDDFEFEGYRIRFRADFTSWRGQIHDYIVQLEIEIDANWHPIIRSDSTHGEAHIDHIDPDGREYDKQWLGIMAPYNRALTDAERDFKTNYRRYARRFLKQLRKAQ